MSKSLTEKSKYVSYILRHKPEAAGLTLDKEGWVDVADFLAAAKSPSVSLEELQQIVAEDSKRRYSFNEDRTRIRANQGHSTSQVEMTFRKAVPPVKLFHGANREVILQIKKQGLLPMNRHHVHLSSDVEMARIVAIRNKKGYVILTVDAKAMLADGFTFYISENDVWLIDHVPPKYLSEETS